MSQINQPFTLGLWTAKKGSEKTFIGAWEAFAKWTAKNQPGAGTACLLQDRDHPQQFVSFGPWQDADAIKFSVF